MKKKWIIRIICLICSIGMLFTMAGCTKDSAPNSDTTVEIEVAESNENEPLENQYAKKFVVIEYFKEEYTGEYPYIQFSQAIVYDPVTMVMYTIIYEGGTNLITPLYNADGTLRVYTGE